MATYTQLIIESVLVVTMQHACKPAPDFKGVNMPVAIHTCIVRMGNYFIGFISLPVIPQLDDSQLYVTGFAKRGLILASNFSTLQECS